MVSYAPLPMLQIADDCGTCTIVADLELADSVEFRSASSDSAATSLI